MPTTPQSDHELLLRLIDAKRKHESRHHVSPEHITSAGCSWYHTHDGNYRLLLADTTLYCCLIPGHRSITHGAARIIALHKVDLLENQVNQPAPAPAPDQQQSLQVPL